MTKYLETLPARRVVNAAGKSEFHVGENGLCIVEELAARGCSVVTIARALGMGKDAFRSVRYRQPEVEEALERGRAIEHDSLVSNLRHAADGGNVVANIVLLKARHTYREGEPLEASASDESNARGARCLVGDGDSDGAGWLALQERSHPCAGPRIVCCGAPGHGRGAYVGWASARPRQRGCGR